MHAYIHTYMHACMHTYIQTYTHIHTYIHTYIHTHIHTYIHTDSSPRTATVFTDSRITLDSLKNANNHAYLIEEIRKSISRLEGPKWKIEFSWVKAHAGIFGNEIADRLAKEAARSKDAETAFNRIPISTLYYELEEEAR